MATTRRGVGLLRSEVKPIDVSVLLGQWRKGPLYVLQDKVAKSTVGEGSATSYDVYNRIKE